MTLKNTNQPEKIALLTNANIAQNQYPVSFLSNLKFKEWKSDKNRLRSERQRQNPRKGPEDACRSLQKKAEVGIIYLNPAF